jgi:hypothetical protein
MKTVSNYITKYDNERYSIHYSNGDAVTAPLGTPYSSKHKELIAELSEDILEHGPDPVKSLSYVTLHSSYSEFAARSPKESFIEQICERYAADYDFALAGLNAPQLKDIILKSLGKKVPRQKILSWLKSSPMRTVMTMYVFVMNLSSVLAGYKLLSTDIPVKDIALGMMKPADMKIPQAELEMILDKMRRYSRFPDELDYFRDEILGITNLKTEFMGKAVNVDKMPQSGWLDHVSPKYPFPFPKNAGAWVLELPSQPHLGYLMISLDKKTVITNFNVLFFTISADGGMELVIRPINREERELILQSCRSILEQ